MISIIIPTLNAADFLARTAHCLNAARTDGLVRELIISDGGSKDTTLEIAKELNAHIVDSQKGRGTQLAAGALAARTPWLLFLHADTKLERGWSQAVKDFINAGDSNTAGYFRFRFDEPALMARLVAFGVALRCRFQKMPYGDQGLLISRKFYDEIGGFKNILIMEDVDIVDRINAAGTLHPINAAAITSAARYRKEGYWRRIRRNAKCMRAWRGGASPEEILELYE
jgi:rSAM/selenodomain-associated transferase 2